MNHLNWSTIFTRSAILLALLAMIPTAGCSSQSGDGSDEPGNLIITIQSGDGSDEPGNLTVTVTRAGVPQSNVALDIKPGHALGVTVENGTYTYENLAPDTYSISACATLDGRLQVGKAIRVIVRPGQTETADINLSPAPSKPSGQGTVHTQGRSLLVGGKPFLIKGVGYSPWPIGTQPPMEWSDWPHEAEIYDRDFSLLQDMHANTLRTWGKVTPTLLQKAAAHDLKVICGFWVVYEANLSDPQVRAGILSEFRQYVEAFKDRPAVLMWSLGNENNYRNGNNESWYTLLNELAWAAYDEEGAKYHPVTTPNGELNNIGDPGKYADDDHLGYLDAWAANVYRGLSFYDLFDVYAQRSQKPFWVSEYGIDAYDHQADHEDEETQARYARQLWQEIMGHAEVCSGGTIMAYCDEWWKADQPETQEPGGFPADAFPDRFSDEEFWGVMRISKSDTGPDQRHPRQIYSVLQELWQ